MIIIHTTFSRSTTPSNISKKENFFDGSCVTYSFGKILSLMALPFMVFESQV